MVSVFLFFYIVSYIDRTVLTMLVSPIQRDLRISDLQFSLLLGPGFGLFYVICGIPMGWLVDRGSRRWITTIGVGVWGLATAFSGLASGFGHLLASRVGVAIGEAALTPSAHAMIADEFPREKMSTAMSVYTAGSAIGGGIAMIAGGLVVQFSATTGGVDLPFLGHVRGWQMTFLLLGLFTVVAAPLALLMRENSRDVGAAAHGTTATGLIGLMRQHPALFIGAPIAFGLINSISQAYNSWIPTFMVRQFGWAIGKVGLFSGLQHLIAGGLGFVVAAMIVDRFYARGYYRAHTIYPIVSLIISVPLAIWGFNCGNPWLFLFLNAPFYLLSYGWIGYAGAALQFFTPRHLRGQVAAMLLVAAAIVGQGIGAPLTAWFTDVVFHDKGALHLSLSAITVILATISILIFIAVSKSLKKLHNASEAVARDVAYAPESQPESV
jgi:MFS family permease